MGHIHSAGRRQLLAGVVGSDVSPSTGTRVHALQRAIETLHPAWLVETVPGYGRWG